MGQCEGVCVDSNSHRMKAAKEKKKFLKHYKSKTGLTQQFQFETGQSSEPSTGLGIAQSEPVFKFNHKMPEEHIRKCSSLELGLTAPSPSEGRRKGVELAMDGDVIQILSIEHTNLELSSSRLSFIYDNKEVPADTNWSDVESEHSPQSMHTKMMIYGIEEGTPDYDLIVIGYLRSMSLIDVGDETTDDIKRICNVVVSYYYEDEL